MRSPLAGCLLLTNAPSMAPLKLQTFFSSLLCLSVCLSVGRSFSQFFFQEELLLLLEFLEETDGQKSWWLVATSATIFFLLPFLLHLGKGFGWLDGRRKTFLLFFPLPFLPTPSIFFAETLPDRPIHPFLLPFWDVWSGDLSGVSLLSLCGLFFSPPFFHSGSRVPEMLNIIDPVHLHFHEKEYRLHKEEEKVIRAPFFVVIE